MDAINQYLAEELAALYKQNDELKEKVQYMQRQANYARELIVFYEEQLIRRDQQVLTLQSVRRELLVQIDQLETYITELENTVVQGATGRRIPERLRPYLITRPQSGVELIDLTEDTDDEDLSPAY